MTADVTHALPRVRGPKSLLTAAIALILAIGMPAMAGSTANAVGQAPALGAAANFAVLAGAAVTCTDATVTGNVGVFPGTAITQTSCPVTGTINAGDTAAAAGQNDFVIAYNELAALPCDQTLTGLGSQALSPGVYCFDAAATQTGGVLTLDGPSNGIWIFKIGVLDRRPHGHQLLGRHDRRRAGIQCVLADRRRRDDDGLELPRNAPRRGGHHYDPWNLRRASPGERRGDDHGHRRYRLRRREPQLRRGQGLEFYDPGNSNQGDPRPVE